MNKPKSTLLFEGQPDILKTVFNSPTALAILKAIFEDTEKYTIKTSTQNILLQYCADICKISEGNVGEKSVCAKIVSRGETIIECYECRMDPSCIICEECYRNGNHKGHKVLFKKAYGGCCDCGDSEAWNPKGFCKNHSGIAKEIPISPKQEEQFVRAMQDLFYIYYYCILKPQSLPRACQRYYFKSLIGFCQTIVSSGLKGIKLLSLFFRQKFPKTHYFNGSLQDDSVLHHLLTLSLVGSDLKAFEDIFIEMFPYYQFKKQLLAAYIECYPRLYKIENGMGQSLSCQILTSYKLVEDYLDAGDSHSIGYNFIIQAFSAEQLDNICYNVWADIDKLCSLQGDVPLKYLRVNFKSSNGLKVIFAHHIYLSSQLKEERIAKVPKINKKISRKKRQRSAMQIEQQQSPQFSLVYFLIRYSKQSQNEYNALLTLNTILMIASHDEALLFQILGQCVSLLQQDEDGMLIFRPFDRAFALIVFYLCRKDLSLLSITGFRDTMKGHLGLSEQQFTSLLTRLENRMLETYLFYTHIVTNEDRGYHSSFYTYLYFYRVKDRFLSSLDTLQLKIIALLNPQGLLMNFQKLAFHEHLDNKKWNRNMLTIMLKEIQLLYEGIMAEIYIAHLDPKADNCKHFKHDITQYLCKFITSSGGSVTLERANEFSKGYLFRNEELLKDYLKDCCHYNKDKKIFELKINFKDQTPFNYKDFELRGLDNIQNSSLEHERPICTIQLITGYNEAIFAHFWQEENLQSLKKIVMALYEEIDETKVDSEMVAFLGPICNFCTILKQKGQKDQGSFIQQLFLRMKLSSAVRKELSLYQDIVGSVQESEANDLMLTEKKDKLKQKKLKKLEELKRRNNTNMDKIKEVHEMDVENEDWHCVICRKKDSNKDSLVYLTKMTVRDHERLLERGPGVRALSFTTCYHVFDYECIAKCGVNNGAHQLRYKCPLCRKLGNILLPIYPKQLLRDSLTTACEERIIQVLISICNYEEVNAAEQLLKSFYHLVIVALFEPDYCKRYRVKLYRTILHLLLTPSFICKLPLLIDSLKNEKINLRPRLLKSGKGKINLMRAREDQQLEDINSSDEEAYEQLMEYLQQRQRAEMRHQNQPFIYKKRQNKSETNHKSGSEKNKMSEIFKYTATRVVKYLQEKSGSSQKLKAELSKENGNQIVQESEQVQIIQKTDQFLTIDLPSIPNQVIAFIDYLFEEPSEIDQKTLKPLKLKLMELPQVFNWDMSESTCALCNNICHDIFYCLLCPWKGCLNCKDGGVTKHYLNRHGESCAVMRLNDASAYFIGRTELKKAGCMYLNEWGEDFSLKKDWSTFMFQPEVMRNLQSMLLKDE